MPPNGSKLVKVEAQEDRLRMTEIASCVGNQCNGISKDTNDAISRGPSDPIESMALLLADQVIKQRLDDNTRSTRSSSLRPEVRCMARCVDEVLDKYMIKFRSMIRQLDVRTPDAVRDAVTSIADCMLEDGHTNWGRVIALYAFGLRLAEHCHAAGRTDLAAAAGDAVGAYVAARLAPWVRDNGGWDALCKQFPEKDALENKFWKGLLTTAAVGLGALATMKFISVR